MQEGESITFLGIAKQYLEDKYNNQSFADFRSQTSRINTITKYINSLQKDDLPIIELDAQFVNLFTIWLKRGRSQRGTRLSERSIVNYLMLIRSLWNCGILIGASNENYPFGKQRVAIKFPDSIKIGLNAQEMKRLEELDLKEGTHIFHDRNIMLFCFAFGGMRIGDALKAKWNSFVDGRYYYIMGKNKKPSSIKISNRAAIILAYYKQDADKTDYIFPHLKSFKSIDPELISKRINNIISNINQNCKRLKEKAKINKQLSTHIMRHTFGNLAGDKISVQALQKIYKHSEIGTTIGYQNNFIYADADAAIDKVVDF